MSDQLPPLPVPAVDGRETGEQDSYTADQMHAYARAAMALAYERAAKACDERLSRFDAAARGATLNATGRDGYMCMKAGAATCADDIRTLMEKVK